MKTFKDRIDAGKQLAKALAQFKQQEDAIIIGLPRGGVPVAFEVAQELGLPLDIIVTRKIGAPLNQELAVGALTQDGTPVWNERVLKSLHLDTHDLEPTIEKERVEAERRLKTYRGKRPPLDLKDKTVIIVDDGVATGATARAALVSAKRMGAKKVVLAIPVSPIDTLEHLEQDADQVICLSLPRTFWSVGGFYESFPQSTDEQVIDLMKQSIDT